MTESINFLEAEDIPPNFEWLNKPNNFELVTGKGLCITTDPKTGMCFEIRFVVEVIKFISNIYIYKNKTKDFWQKTHYGFQNDNGHCLMREIAGDFELTTFVRFAPKNEYDQCGLIVRIDSDNWIKVSTEYIDEKLAQLGAVVTNKGFSDWSTVAISPGLKVC